MAAVPALTTGAIKNILNKHGVHSPRLQVLSVEKRSTKRHRLVVSDGECRIDAYLNSQLHGLVDSGMLCEHALFTLKDWAVHTGHTRPALIVAGVEDCVGGDASMCDAAEDVPASTPPMPTRAQSLGADVVAPSGRVQNAPEAVLAGVGPGDAVRRRSVSELRPGQGMGTLEGRLVLRGAPKMFRNGLGKLVNVHLEDTTGRVRMTGFNDKVVNLILEQTVLGDVYRVVDTRAQVKECNPQYRDALCIDLEITLSSDVRFTPLTEAEAAGTAPPKAAPIPISDALALPEGATVPCIKAVVIQVENAPKEFPRKDGTGVVRRRQIELADATGVVRVALFGAKADMCFTDEGKKGLPPTVMLTDGSINDYNGTRSLTYGDRSNVVVVDEDPELTRFLTRGVRAISACASTTGTVVMGHAFLSLVAKPPSKDDVVYPACPLDETHMHALTRHSDDAKDGYDCPKCNPDALPIVIPPKWRWGVAATLTDETGSHTVTVYEPHALALVGGVDAETYRASPDPAVLSSMQFREFRYMVRVDAIPDAVGAVRMVSRVLHMSLRE